MITGYLERATGLQRDALLALARPEDYPALSKLRTGDVVLRLLRFVAIAQYSAWAVATCEHDYLVRRIVWNRGQDSPSGPAQKPTIYACEAPVSARLLEPHLQSLRAMTLPPFASCGKLGLDGVHYGVESGNYCCSAGLYWWNAVPEAWGPLDDWFANVLAALDGLLPPELPPHG
jgi:hypothetical protein